MATCFPFLPIWLSDVIGLNKTETGIVFSSLSLFAICFQPVLGVISDKLGLKKHLMWIVTILLVLIAPFFLYVFAPLLKTNIWLGALSGGAYIGFVFSAGAGAMEAYIERISRNSGLEYGKARTFGCLGWALCATTAGMLFSVNPEWVFWMGSACRAAAGGAGGYRETAGQPGRSGFFGRESPIGGFKKRPADVPPAQNVDVYSVCGRRGVRIRRLRSAVCHLL